MAWIEGRLDKLNIELTGPAQQIHLTQWSTVLQIPISSGSVFFKATLPALAYEAAVTDFLGRQQPHRTIPPLATDPDRGWMILPAAGAPLRPQLNSLADLHLWEEALPVYARLQLDLVDHVSTLPSLGVPDRRPETLLQELEQIVANPEAVRHDKSFGLETGYLEKLPQLASRLGVLARSLAFYGLPATLDHGDLHDNHVLPTESGFRFYDWGECAVAHPFFSLRTAFVSVENRLNLTENDPAFDPLLQAYLRTWTDYGSLTELNRAYLLSEPLASLSTLVRWWRVLTGIAPEGQSEYAYVVPSLLEEIIDKVDVTDSLT
jgi:hypothetical protein